MTLASVRASSDGAALEFVGLDDSVIGTVTLPAPLVPMGDWGTGLPYTTRHIATYGGSAYLCAEAHVSGVFEDDLADGKWVTLASGGGSSEPPAAADVPYAPAPGSLIDGAETVQSAIDMLASALEMTQTAISDLENELELRLQAIEGRLDALDGGGA